jgi:outer membrane autotransporter protein
MRESAVPAAVSIHAANVRLCRLLVPLFASLLRCLAAVSVLAAMLLRAAPAPAQTYDVSNTADIGAGSLRQAVADLNASGAAGDIRFISGSSGPIDLTSGWLTLTQQASLQNDSGGAVTVSRTEASFVTTLSATSLGTIGGASALAIEANATGTDAYGIRSWSALSIGSIASTGSITATAGTSEAYGLRASGDVVITNAMAGDIAATAASGNNAYGIYSQSGALSIGSIAETGSITATAGVFGAYGLRGDSGVTITGDLAGDIAATVTNGSTAYGITSSGALSIGSIAESGSITATAGTNNALGLYGYNGVTITGAVAGDITATAGGNFAYGILSSGGALSIGSIASTGSIAATAGTDNAYGLRASGGVTIAGEMAGDIAATAASGSNAYGIYSQSGALSIGSIASTGSVTATAGTNYAYGLYGTTGVTITGAMAGDIAATAASGTNAYGIYSSGGAISIDSIAETGSIAATAGTDNAYGLRTSGAIAITGEMAGDIAAEVTSGSNAFGIYSLDAISIGSITSSGSISATAGTSHACGLYAHAVGITITGEMAGDIAATATNDSSAYGIYSSGGAISIGAIAQTGQIMALAGTDEAYGIRAFDNVTITGQMAGSIFAMATGGDNAYGILAESGDVSIGDMGGAASDWASVIAQAGGDTAVGIGAELGSVTIASLGQYSQVMATAGGMTAFGIQAGDTLTITGDLGGMVIASAGTMAAGLTAGTVSIGSVSQTGWISAHSAGDEAYGILAACDVSISGGMAGIISAVADGNTAVGIMAFQELNGGDADTALAVSGLVSAQADGLAVAVASGEAMNLHVTGTLSGVDTSGGGQGYAIRAGVADGFGGWIAGSADNTVTLGTGAHLVGKVDLGTGDNTLGLIGTGAADNLFLGVDHLTAGDGSTAASWNLSLSSGNASTFADLDINALATLRINENVTITGNTVNDGIFIYDLGADTTYAGVVSGAGTLVKDGAATLTLSGNNTSTGATWVMEGLLDVTGTLASSDYQVDAGAGIRFATNTTIDGDAVVNGTWTSPLLTVGSTGTLMGVGTIEGDVESHGTIAPGLSAGTLTIDGDLLLGSGSLLNLEITPTASDLLHVTGATTISEGSLHVAIADGYYTSGQQFTLLSSDGGLTGDYQTITIDNQSSFLQFSVTNTDTATVGAFGGSVSVVRLPYSIAATSRNSFGASLGLTGATLVATPAMQSVLAKIDFMTLAEAEQGMRQMSPEPYSALVETSFAAMRLFSDTIRERAYATRGGGESVLAMVPGGEMSRMTELASREIGSDAPTGITAKSGTAGGLGLFVKPVGQYVNFDSAKNRTGFQSWQYGMVAGGDLAVNDNLLAGFQVGYVHSDLSFSDTATSTGRSDTFLGGLYASYASGGFYADGLVQAGAAWNRLVRKIEFGSISSQPEGTYVSFLFGGSLTTGYDWTFGKFKAGPVATLDYGYVAVPGFSETGDAELGLTVRAFSGNSLKSGLGAKVSGTFTAGEKTTISPDVSLRWGHEFLDDSQNVKARFNGSPTSSFSAKTGEPARDNLLVDAGVSLGVSDSTKLYLRYSGQLLGQGSQTQAGAVGVRYEF